MTDNSASGSYRTSPHRKAEEMVVERHRKGPPERSYPTPSGPTATVSHSAPKSWTVTGWANRPLHRRWSCRFYLKNLSWYTDYNDSGTCISITSHTAKKRGWRGRYEGYAKAALLQYLRDEGYDRPEDLVLWDPSEEPPLATAAGIISRAKSRIGRYLRTGDSRPDQQPEDRDD